MGHFLQNIREKLNNSIDDGFRKKDDPTDVIDSFPKEEGPIIVTPKNKRELAGNALFGSGILLIIRDCIGFYSSEFWYILLLIHVPLALIYLYIFFFEKEDKLIYSRPVITLGWTLFIFEFIVLILSIFLFFNGKENNWKGIIISSFLIYYLASSLIKLSKGFFSKELLMEETTI